MSGPRPFESWLAEDFAGYLLLKRALGRKLANEERVLRHLDRFLAENFPAAHDLSVPILKQWMVASPGLQPQSRAVRLRIVRPFCLYRRRTIPDAFVPDRIQHRLLWPARTPRCAAFIFSKEQVRQLLRAARALPECPRGSGRPQVFFTLLLLLYTTGLRLSEAVRLRVGDVDLDVGTLLIRDTKFFKTRVVPVAADVLEHLRLHIAALPLARTPAIRERALFQHSGRAYSVTTVGATGRQLLRDCGLKPAHGRAGPCLHSLRHTFAVHRIAAWYAEGADVQNRLPFLATYMGHKNIASTQYYATVTTEILEHAGHRFECACAPHPGR